MGKAIFVFIIIVVLVITALSITGRLDIFTIFNQRKASTLTTSKMTKAINVNELSTSEFVYNGIAQVLDSTGDKTKYNVLYNATVKMGIRMDWVVFKVDKEAKTVRPILPEIRINSVTIDTSSISYIPVNSDVDLKEAFSACKEDVEKEASTTKELYNIAQENVESTIEALLHPILESNGYVIVWEN